MEHLHRAFHKIPLMWLNTSLNIAYVYTHNAELSVVITQIITFIGALYVPSEAEDSDIGRGNTIIELLTFTFTSSFLKLLLEKAALSQYLCTVTEDSWWVLALCINHLVSTLTVRGYWLGKSVFNSWASCDREKKQLQGRTKGNKFKMSYLKWPESGKWSMKPKINVGFYQHWLWERPIRSLILEVISEIWTTLTIY